MVRVWAWSPRSCRSWTAGRGSAQRAQPPAGERHHWISMPLDSPLHFLAHKNVHHWQVNCIYERPSSSLHPPMCEASMRRPKIRVSISAVNTSRWNGCVAQSD